METLNHEQFNQPPLPVAELGNIDPTLPQAPHPLPEYGRKQTVAEAVADDNTLEQAIRNMQSNTAPGDIDPYATVTVNYHDAQKQAAQETFFGGNTKRLKAVLQDRRKASALGLQTSKQHRARFAGKEADAATQTANDTASANNTSMLNYRSIVETSIPGHDESSDEQKARAKSNKDQVFRNSAAVGTASKSLYAQRRAGKKAGMASRDAANHTIHEQKVRSLNEDLTNEYADRIESPADRAAEAQKTSLTSWKLGERQDVSNRLQYTLDLGKARAKTLEEFSSADSGLHERQTDFIKDRFRLEERKKYEEQLIDPRNNGNSEFTVDGGIRIDVGTSDESIIYPDGTSVRSVTGADGYSNIRRNSRGEYVKNAPLEFTELTGTKPYRDLDEITTTWEATRDPEHANLLHNELNEHINYNNQVAEAHNDTVVEADDQIAAQNKVINDIQDAARNSGTRINREQSDMITAAKATISKLAVARMSAQNQLAATRKTLNPQIFLQKYLEVNSTVKNRPEKLPEGRVATTDRVNGIDGMWAISSNGGAVLFTDSDPAGQFAHYAPDGKFLGKSNSSF